MFKLSKISFEIMFVVHGYPVHKDIWEVQISSEMPCLPSQIIAKISCRQNQERRESGSGSGSLGDEWVKPGDWEMGDHVTELCCFDFNLKLVKAHRQLS